MSAGVAAVAAALPDKPAHTLACQGCCRPPSGPSASTRHIATSQPEGHAERVKERTAVDEDWLTGVLSEQTPLPGTAESIERLRALLSGWAQGFAERRADVRSGTLAEPRGGLHADEASSFLRAAPIDGVDG